MREIEFRAWDRDKKEMLYVEPWSSSHRMMTWGGCVYEHGRFQVELVIEQWTGFYDKNETKIFEGDIVFWRPHKNKDKIFKMEIYWDQTAAGFFMKGEPNLNEWLFCFDDQELEVIGNIHEGVKRRQ